MTKTEDQIVSEMITAMKHLDAQSDLLCIVCSLGDTLSDDEVLEMLRDWNNIKAAELKPET